MYRHRELRDLYLTGRVSILDPVEGAQADVNLTERGNSLYHNIE